MKKIELLAPAGDMNSLKAAISAGADAIYLGGKSFGARAFSKNFDDNELIEAINYAHLYGVKIYVTCNTMIYEREVDEFIKYVGFLHKNNVDAILVQDLGMLDLIRKTYPNLEVHSSTQMHIHNLDGVKLMESLGVKRVVLARETSIDEIKHIKEHPIIAAREILTPISYVQDIIPIVEYHHENWNGSGYPSKISKESIPIASQIVLIVDAYYALTEQRSYRDKLEPKEALEVIKKDAGVKWSKTLVNEFTTLIENELK